MNIADFTKADESQKWRIINDGVMGGNSEGVIQFKDIHGTFKGYISLDNNGGFSSAVRSIDPIKQSLTTFIIDVETNNNTDTHDTAKVYQLRAVMNVDGYRLAYKHDFTLAPNHRKQIHLPLDTFEASFRGRLISNAPVLTSQEIIEVGLLVKSEVAGEFALRIFSIKLI